MPELTIFRKILFLEKMEKKCVRMGVKKMVGGSVNISRSGFSACETIIKMGITVQSVNNVIIMIQTRLRRRMRCFMISPA